MSGSIAKIALGALSLAGAMNANATIVTASASPVATIDTYTQYGSGDVVFHLVSNSLQSSCPYGFWIRPSDGGAKSALAQVLAAYETGKSVAVSADNAIIWSGAGSAACLVWAVSAQ